MLRYQENNELHRDFHGSTNLAIHYLIENYGAEAAKAVLRKTGREVYKSIHGKLAKGDDSELVEHLSWFAHREGAKYKMTVSPGEVTFEMLECPAVRHLRKLGIVPDELTCLQTSEVNAGMCEGTPWDSSLEILGEGHCIQRFKKVRDCVAATPTLENV